MLSKIKSLLQKFKKRKSANPDQTGDFEISADSLDSNHAEEAPEEFIEQNENALSLKEKITYFFRKMSFKKRPKLNFSSRANQVTKIKNIDINQINYYLFSSRYKNQIHQSFLIFYVLLCAYTIGKMTAVILRGSQMHDDEKMALTIQLDDSQELKSKDLEFIKTSNIFKTNSAEGKSPTENQMAKCEKTNGRSNLPYKLVNTVVLQDSVKSVAAVQVRSDLSSFREGDTIENTARIDRIERLSLLVKNLQSGTCETITNENELLSSSRISVLSPSASKAFTEAKKKMAGIDNEGNKFSISKTLINEKIKDISSILTQARGIQMNNPDGSMSFKIVDIEPGGIFSYLGIQDQDMITQINGRKINDLNEIMSLFGKLQNLDNLQLTINRDGQEVPLEYSFK
jgi:type II secretion system protein C